MTRFSLSEQTQAILTNINADTGKLFEQLGGTLELLGDDGFEKFNEQCVAIASHGWRSFEALNLLLRITPVVLTKQGESGLLRVLNYGKNLAGYSTEPVVQYYHCLRELLDVDATQQLSLIEKIGRQLHNKNEHASALNARFFRVASKIALRGAAISFEDWSIALGALIPMGREPILDFFKSSEQLTQINWKTVRTLLGSSMTHASAYMQHFEQFCMRTNPKQINQIDQLLIKFAVAGSSRDGFSDLAESLGVWLSGDTDMTSLATLLDVGGMLNDVKLYDCLIRHAYLLPITRDALMKRWVVSGIDATQSNHKAGIAYFSLESSLSVQTLESLRGQVNFSDWQRVFDLIAEAIVGRRLRVISDETGGDFRLSTTAHLSEPRLRETAITGADPLNSLPGTDGRNIHLPGSVSLFENAQDNFGFYKVSLMHQLGYFEFGCFDHIQWVEKMLAEHDDKLLAERIFLIVEDARIDWQLSTRFEGLAPQLNRQKAHALESQILRGVTRRSKLLVAMLATGLDFKLAQADSEADDLWQEKRQLEILMLDLRPAGATLEDSIRATRVCYQIINASTAAAQNRRAELSELDGQISAAELPPPIAFRGEISVDTVQATLKIDALLNEIQEQLDEDNSNDATNSSQNADLAELDIGDLKKGELSDGLAVLMTELQNELSATQGGESQDANSKEDLMELLGGVSRQQVEASRHLYDEWDFEISDYRARWCTLFELRELDEDEEFVRDTLVQHQDLAKKIKTELNRVRPEMLRKIKGVLEGEELDLDKTIAYLVDRKAGLTPDEGIYVQKQRRDRDVSTLFLLDMSASTDDIIPNPEAEPSYPLHDDNDDFMAEFFEQQRAYQAGARRIIDLEKESVVLMAEALERLGDSYAVCGFSGYGRERVDYHLCKDFDEAFGAKVRGRIGGIKPSRSTRMGAPIRHAARQLVETGSRVKALIVISDGYPQDHDYGSDRNSREYGLKDTMKALSEAKQQGVLTFCLTVDPSGHDYLRAMCPDSQYMVIQDIAQLPEELARVYRSLTG